MNATADDPEPHATGQRPDGNADLRYGRSSTDETTPRPDPCGASGPAGLYDAASAGQVIDALDQWDVLSRDPWDIALLIALDDGPTTPSGACDAARSWANGHLADTDLPMVLIGLVDTGLALHLGGRGDAGLLAITSSGEWLLDRFEFAVQQCGRLHEVVRFADSCAFHDRLRRLTATETRVLRLVADGQSDKQIAAGLGLSRRSIERHLRLVIEKLELTSRNALIARLTIEATAL